MLTLHAGSSDANSKRHAEMKYFGITDKGIVRKDNQDNFALLEDRAKNNLIVVLCDGMGGSNSGGMASEVAKNAFSEFVLAKLSSRVNKNPDIKKVLISACEESNSLTCEYSALDEKLEGMGTTLVGGVVNKNGRVKLVNVGDSRAYVVSADNKSIRQITVDNSLVQELVSYGIITEDEAQHHSRKNVITKAVGTESSIDPDYYEFYLKRGEMLLLCSDGLSNYVSEEQIIRTFIKYPQPEKFCRTMLDITLKLGAPDNVTIISVVNE